MAKVKEGKQGNVWIVKGGDNVAKIARDVYGNERMMAEIMRLNGGVKTLRPGMVLRLPAAKKNSDIFISNDWAANMGMATNDQVAQWYDQNPNAGGMTASWNAAGGGWKNSIAGGGPGLNPGIQNGALVPNPSGPSNAWGNNLDALGAMQGGTANTSNPYGSNADAIAAMRANAARSTNANRPQQAPAIPGMNKPYWQLANTPPALSPNADIYDNKFPRGSGLMDGRYMGGSHRNAPPVSSSSPNADIYQNNPYGYGNPLDTVYRNRGFLRNNTLSAFQNDPFAAPSFTGENNQKRNNQNPVTPSAQQPFSIPGAFGAVKNTFLGNPTPPPVAMPPAAQGSLQGPLTPLQWETAVKQGFGITGGLKIVPTAYNQNPADIAKLAPLVQQAVNAYAYSSKLPPGSSGATFTLAQAKILEQAGMIQPGTDNYKQIMEYLNQNTPAPTADTPTTNTNGSWDVWNLGGTQKPVWMEQQYKRGGGRLSDYSGYIRSSYGPSLGLKNWRGIE